MRPYLTVSQEGLMDKLIKVFSGSATKETERELHSYITQFTDEVKATLGNSQWLEKRKVSEKRLDASEIAPVIVETPNVRQFVQQLTGVVDNFYDSYGRTLQAYNRNFIKLAEKIENAKDQDDYVRQLDAVYPKLLGPRVPKVSSYPELPSGLVYGGDESGDDITSVKRWLSLSRKGRRTDSIRPLKKPEIVEAGEDILNLIKRCDELLSDAYDKDYLISIDWWDGAWRVAGDQDTEHVEMFNNIYNRTVQINNPLYWYIDSLMVTAFALERWCLRSLK